MDHQYDGLRPPLLAQVVINQLLGDIRPGIKDTVSVLCRAVIEGCWATDPARRPSAAKVACILSGMVHPPLLLEGPPPSDEGGGGGGGAASSSSVPPPPASPARRRAEGL